MSSKKKYNLFSILTIFLVAILPFYVILKVFFEFKLGINFFGILLKEFVIFLLILSLIFEFIVSRKKVKLELLDYLIFAYFAYGVLITLINGLGLEAIFYGGRYDFEFLVVFLIFRHGSQFLQVKKNKLIKIFTISAAVSLFLGVTVRIIGEEFLTIVGFNFYVSDWTFTGSIPMYHGVEDSGLRRFQGILDGPNQMAFFLITFGSIALYRIKKLEFHHVLFVAFLILLLVLTYSRSAALGLGVSLLFAIVLNLKSIFIKYKKYIIIVGIFLIVLTSFLYINFQRHISNIFLRPASTMGHFVRMEIGIKKFLEAPLGHGLATSGPAYRQVFTMKNTKEEEKYFIPESWYIQQLVEGGIVYFLLFCIIQLMILFRVYKKSLSLAIGFLSILIMNMFLHIFEATYLAILLFMFLGVFLQKDYYKNNK